MMRGASKHGTVKFGDICGVRGLTTQNLENQVDHRARSLLIPGTELVESIESSSGIKLDSQPGQIDRVLAASLSRDVNISRGRSDAETQASLLDMAGYQVPGLNAKLEKVDDKSRLNDDA